MLRSLLPWHDILVSLITESVFTHVDLLLTTSQRGLIRLATLFLLQKREANGKRGRRRKRNRWSEVGKWESGRRKRKKIGGG